MLHDPKITSREPPASPLTIDADHPSIEGNPPAYPLRGCTPITRGRFPFPRFLACVCLDQPAFRILPSFVAHCLLSPLSSSPLPG